MPLAESLAAAASGAGAAAISQTDPGGLLSGFALSGRGARVDQEFQKLFANIDYKLQRQELHRDDIRDLMGLTVNRLDMYNVVAALLLTFVFSWLTDNSVVAMSGTRWPKWFISVFVINAFAATGYLVLSLWFSMHGAIMSQTLGTKILTSFTRLSIPTKEQINRMRVKFYRSFHDPAQQEDAAPAKKLPFGKEAGSSGAAQMKKRPALKKAEVAAFQKGRGPLLPPANEGEYAGDESEEDGMELVRTDCGTDLDLSGCKNDSDVDFDRHFRRWIEDRKRWSSYDCCSRLSMVAGMNLMLQALCYNIAADVWEVSPLLTWVCIGIAKMLSYHVLRIDVGGRSSDRFDRCMVIVCELTPPILTLAVLNAYPPAPPSGEKAPDGEVETLFALPVFVLHATWMFFLGKKLTPFSVMRYRKLADASSDSEEASDSYSDSEYAGHSATAAKSARSFTSEEQIPKQFRALQGLEVVHASTTPVGSGDVNWGSQSRQRHPDHTPVDIVRSFTLKLAWFWLVAAALHVIRCLRLGSEAHVIPSLRSLTVLWPQPEAFFEVTRLHCSGSSLIVGDRFGSHIAPLPSGNVDERRMGPLRRLRLHDGGQVQALLCGRAGAPDACDALVLTPPSAAGDAGNGTWSLIPLQEIQTSVAAATPALPKAVSSRVQVPIPQSWRLVTGVWTASGPDLPGSAAEGLLAAWDGSAVLVARLARRASAGAAGAEAASRWTVEPLFELRPKRYTAVAALQLSANGHALSVLHRGSWDADTELDVWSLKAGALREQMRLQAGARSLERVAMCHDGEHVFFARQAADGPPVLEVAPVPATAASTSAPSSSGEASSDAAAAAAPRLLL